MGTTDEGPGDTTTRDSERRWEQWMAHGAAQDRSTQRLAIGVVVAGACGLAVWLAAILMQG